MWWGRRRILTPATVRMLTTNTARRPLPHQEGAAGSLSLISSPPTGRVTITGMEATATRNTLTLTMPVHPSLVGRDDITGFLSEVLDDVLDDYLNLRETAYVGYRMSGHEHTRASNWAHAAAQQILPRGSTLAGGDGL